MNDERHPGRSPWLCHVCDTTSDRTESRSCAVCYRVTCDRHLKRAMLRNSDSGLYEAADVCILCA